MIARLTRSLVPAWAILVLAAPWSAGQTIERVPLPKSLGESPSIHSTGFSPGGTYFWVCCPRGLQVWRMAGRQPEWSVQLPDNAYKALVVWSLDEKSVALAAYDNRDTKVNFYDAARGERASRLEIKGIEFTRLTMAPDGKSLVGHFREGRAACVAHFDRKNGVRRSDVAIDPQSEEATDQALSPDGKLLAAVTRREGVKHGLRLWDPLTGQEFTPPERNRDVADAIAFLPDSKRLVTAHRDGTLALWDVSDPNRANVIRVTETAFRGLGGGRLLVGGTPAVIALIHSSGVQFFTADGQPSGSIRSYSIDEKASLSPDGSRLLTAGRRELALWPISQFLEAGPKPDLLDEVTNSANQLRITADGSVIARRSHTGDAMFFESVTGKVKREIKLFDLLPGQTNISGFDAQRGLAFTQVRQKEQPWAYSITETALVSGQSRTQFTTVALKQLFDRFEMRASRGIHVRTAPTGDRTFVTLETEWILLDGDQKPLERGQTARSRPRALFSPDGKTLVREQEAGKLAVHDARTGQVRLTLRFPGFAEPDPSEGCAFGPEGRHLLGRDGSQIWQLDLKSGSIDYPFPLFDANAHTAVRAFAVAPSAGLVALACDDVQACIRVLDLRTHAVIATLPLPAPLEGDLLAFSPDGKTLWAGVPSTRRPIARVTIINPRPQAPRPVLLHRWDLSKLLNP